MSGPQLGTLTTSCTAIAPAIPLIELTSIRSLCIAATCLLEMPLARFTTIHRLLRDLPQAVPLPNIFGRARAPFLPICQNAVLRDVATHRTALCLKQRPITGVAALIVGLCNDTLPLTEAHTRRLVPVAPLREMAMSWNACRRAVFHNRALESLQLGAHARRLPVPLEDEVRRFFLRGHRPASHRGAEPTLARAVRIRPLRPSAVGGLIAMAGAVRHLLGALGLARSATVIRQRFDGAVPPPLTAALGAVAPIRPWAPLAFLAEHRLARLRVARRGGAQAVAARSAAINGGHLDGPLPLHLATPTRHRAPGPIFPLIHEAIHPWSVPAVD
mmetsp:Transcript_124604/g.265790  ORF Transcript_124604/g.265790 Transcript_124604/m.265790 type:complete len:330 (-) Transcript_124604:1865-2854(-)